MSSSLIVVLLSRGQPKIALHHYLRSPRSPCLPLVAGLALTKTLTKSANAYTSSLTLFRAAGEFKFTIEYAGIIFAADAVWVRSISEVRSYCQYGQVAPAAGQITCKTTSHRPSHGCSFLRNDSQITESILR